MQQREYLYAIFEEILKTTLKSQQFTVAYTPYDINNII